MATKYTGFKTSALTKTGVWVNKSTLLRFEDENQEVTDEECENFLDKMKKIIVDCFEDDSCGQFTVEDMIFRISDFSVIEISLVVGNDNDK